MPDDATEDFVDPPASGRCFATDVRVTFTDTDTTGRARFDALVRHIQQLAGDDNDDAGVGGSWVVRRTALRIERSMRVGETARALTWCSGTAPRWTERRTSLAGDMGGAVEASVIWVHVDPATGAPAPLPAGFAEVYEAAGGRRATARLRHRGPPSQVGTMHWSVRRTDLDLLGHVNNAAAWEMLEELWPTGRSRAVLAELEHREALNHGEDVEVAFVSDDDVLQLWAHQRGRLAITALAGDPSEVRRLRRSGR